MVKPIDVIFNLPDNWEDNKDHYKQAEDVTAIRKVYPITSFLFSVGLIKLRYEKMHKDDQIRAEKTLRYWQNNKLNPGFWK
tara:strand:- start:78 stop:320 length:243 start_codon:yes stop_codon:yes gene_type:complete